MSKTSHIRLFNKIAPIYGWFFRSQKKKYYRLIKRFKKTLDLPNDTTFLDIGCGTGAFCQALSAHGFDATGLDASKSMLKTAKKKTDLSADRLINADATETLPFKDDSFDVVFASYVAHGLNAENRHKLYQNMQRLAKKYVILHDYNETKRIAVSIVETLERGYYFEFIKRVKHELNTCENNQQPCFESVDIYRVNKHASWYVCQVKKT